jgi:hypothetical protein
LPAPSTPSRERNIGGDSGKRRLAVLADKIGFPP